MSLELFPMSRTYEALIEEPLEDEAEGELAARVDEIEGEAEDKVLALAKAARILEAEAELLEEHARLLNARANARLRRADFLRRRVKLELEAAGMDRVRDPFISVWLQQSPPAVEVVDEELIPPEYRRAVLRLPYAYVPAELRPYLQHMDVDRSGILELAKRKGEVPDGVHIRSGDRHLRIR